MAKHKNSSGGKKRTAAYRKPSRQQLAALSDARAKLKEARDKERAADAKAQGPSEVVATVEF
ncbi:hypothetical protein [Actinoplanes aureus]|uniref:Uncharacterized protein n=1 Tax=Actinoplanes aureus TaxID=2792083 RepID=A0A931G3C6_9ACTN|nr:hypothetical protein [Actinoplanes aureus]MBG0564889.1 hypothetical protein [Actinoplanes aureus]MBG0569100.1 hypothetical protein [Actinoplanes aureus]